MSHMTSRAPIDAVAAEQRAGWTLLLGTLVIVSAGVR